MYNTQKDHWLGWLDPSAGTGSYPRRSGDNRGAQHVYNHIRESMMLLWLISAAGVRDELVVAAKTAAESVASFPAKAPAIRKHVPWSEVAAALSKK